jgi:hypothetical protein
MSGHDVSTPGDRTIVASLNHVGIAVTDLDASRAFYVEVVGMGHRAMTVRA